VWCKAEPQSWPPKGRRLHGAAALRHVPVSKKFASRLKIFAAYWSAHGRPFVSSEVEPQSRPPIGRRLHRAAALRHVLVSRTFASRLLKIRATYWSAQGRHLVWCEAEPQSWPPKGRRLHGVAALRYVPVTNKFASCLKTPDSGSLANKHVAGTPRIMLPQTRLRSPAPRPAPSRAIALAPRPAGRGWRAGRLPLHPGGRPTFSTMRLRLFFDGRYPGYAFPVLAE
jgi:hypothetical protein